ncbi:MAG TPA: GAF domain-containing sensor histidine kinase [Egibacteraceae bacterium]
MATQWETRQSRLLDAVLQVTSGLDLSTILQRVVEAAVVLVDARHGALGVLREDGRGLVEFVHTGFDDETVRRIGHLPEGHGILGQLIRDPRPLRLRRLSDHPASVGVPPGHPHPGSFLGVPIRVRGEVFGNLYLTDKVGAEEFSEDDEELLVGLAAVAGAAIENARLYERSRRREQWLDALHRVSVTVAESDNLEEALREVTAAARTLVGADVASIAVPTPDDDEFEIIAAMGDLSERLQGARFPKEGSLTQEALRREEPLVLEDVSDHPHSGQPVVQLGAFGPAMFVPLRARGQGFGTITLANRHGGRLFDEVDLRLLETFARQASLALEREQSRRALARLALLEDRERIGRDLHDTVIQQLFALGLDLESVAGRLREVDPAVSRRLELAVATLDDVIKEIRSTIFAVRRPDTAHLVERVTDVVMRASGALGFDPEVAIDAAAGAPSVPAHVIDELAAVLREALSNVARHARATRAEVTVHVGSDLLLRVADNGVGLGVMREGPSERGGFGLGNMRSRAEALGGVFTIESSPEGGTTLQWQVPLNG